MKTLLRTAALALPLAAFLATGCSSSKTKNGAPTPTPTPVGLAHINHVVVLYLENHGFDNMYGEFPGADGLSTASATSMLQLSTAGVAFATLPQPMDTATHLPDPNFPANIPNGPFLIDTYLSPNLLIPDLVHRYYQEQLQINGGSMNEFTAISDAKGLAMGHYRTADLPLSMEAARYTLCDHFHHAAFGGSFLNHIFFVSAAAPVFAGGGAANPTKIAVYDSNGSGVLVRDGFLRYDDYVINTAFTVNAPHPAAIPTVQLVPNQTMPTIGDRLSAANVTWAWFSGGWNDAIAGTPDPSFQFHHQPFAYFANFSDGTPAKAAHLKDETDFFAAAAAGTLPAVSFVKPLGKSNEHPGYTDVMTGEGHALELIDAVRTGPNWADTAIIITYDENGGFWDHVTPPTVDEWGPGARVPTLVISPYAKKGFIDHTVYDTTAILKLIETRFNVQPLTARDAAAPDMTAAFDFTQTP
jgi:phospholipase C